jgi:2-polyprenyl-3-methyl-5-hydroxy-6-metoxy-1,4-benzoquinol methylase
LIDPTELFPEIPNIYAFPSVHASMLYDNERVEKYNKAIRKIIKPGDVVADIGTGTGLLAFLCLKAGAKKVYAIERSSAIEWAKKIADMNGVKDKIEFLKADSLDCDLEEKVDVIVSELIGHIAFEEGMAESLFDAKERFLAPNGIMIPEKVELKVALVEESQLYSDSIDCWEDIEGIDFSSMREEAVKACYLTNLKSSNLLSKPSTVFIVDFEDKQQLFLENKKNIKIHRKGIIHGIALWFEASLCSNISISSGPFNEKGTHWQQCFAPLSEPLVVNQNEEISVEIKMQLRTKEMNDFKFEFEIKK